MIVFLDPVIDFSPTPRVNVRLVEEAFSWDGGGPGDTGPDSLDGGAPSTGADGFDAGGPSTLSVTVPEGTDAVTLRRTSEGRTFDVRGAVLQGYSGGYAVQDVEAPLRGGVASYELLCFSGGEPNGSVSLGGVFVPRVGEGYHAVIQPPFEPALSVLVEEMQANAGSVTRAAPLELVRSEDAYVPSVVSRGQRSGLSGVQLEIALPDRDVAARVWATLGSQDDPQMPVWLVRSTNPLLPGVFFCAVAEVSEESIDLHLGGVQSRLVATVVEVAPPAPGLVVSALTKDDIDVSYATYDDRDMAYATTNDMDTDWSLAGAAG